MGKLQAPLIDTSSRNVVEHAPMIRTGERIAEKAVRFEQYSPLSLSILPHNELSKAIDCNRKGNNAMQTKSSLIVAAIGICAATAHSPASAAVVEAGDFTYGAGGEFYCARRSVMV